MAATRLHAHLADGRLDDWPALARGGLEASRPPRCLRPGVAGLAGGGRRRLALRDWRFPGPARAGRRGRPGEVPPEAPCPWAADAVGFCAKPRGPGSSLGPGAT